MKSKAFFPLSFVHTRSIFYARIQVLLLYIVVILAFSYGDFFTLPSSKAEEPSTNKPTSISINRTGLSSKITGIVIVDKGNIRSEPDTTSMIVDQLKMGTTVMITEEKEDWYKVEVSSNRWGWMHTSLVQKLSPGQSVEDALLAQQVKYSLVLKVPIARVRESPNPEAPVKFRLYRNDRVLVIGMQNDWKRIELDDGRSGWVHQSLFYPLYPTTPIVVKKVEDTPSPVPVADTQMPKSEANAPTPSDETGTREIQDVQMKVISETEEWVLFMLNGFFTPEISVTAGENPTVICDFSEISLGEGVQHPIEMKGKLIQQIHIPPENQTSDDLRIVLSLLPGHDYQVQPLFYKKNNQYVLVIKSKDNPVEVPKISN